MEYQVIMWLVSVPETSVRVHPDKLDGGWVRSNDSIQGQQINTNLPIHFPYSLNKNKH